MEKTRHSKQPTKSEEKRIEFILSHLSAKDRKIFLSELMTLTFAGKKSELLECVLDWEETAQINAVPLRKRKIMARYASLIRMISGECKA